MSATGDNARNGSIVEMGDDLRFVGETIVHTGVPGLWITHYREWQTNAGCRLLEIRALNRKSGSEYEFNYEYRIAQDSERWVLVGFQGHQNR